MGERSWTSAGWTSGLTTGASVAETRGHAPSAGIPAIFQNDRMLEDERNSGHGLTVAGLAMGSSVDMPGEANMGRQSNSLNA